MRTILFLILFPLSTFAGNKYYSIIGGGGDSREQKAAQFVTPFKNFIGNTPQVANVLFDGVHPESYAQVQASTTKTVEKFNHATIENFLNRMASDIESGKIKTGDQVLIYIANHGSPKNEATETHFISVDKQAVGPDEKRLQDQPLNLDELKKIRDLCKKKGIKLALIDGSCYSGNSLALADENTCVISSASRSQVSFQSFADNMTANLKSGTNLEDAFLKARASSVGGRPAISTPQGVELMKELEDLDSGLYSGDMIYSFQGDRFYDQLRRKTAKTPAKYLSCAPASIDTVEQVARLQNSLGDLDVKHALKTMKEEVSFYQKQKDAYDKQLEVIWNKGQFPIDKAYNCSDIIFANPLDQIKTLTLENGDKEQIRFLQEKIDLVKKNDQCKAIHSEYIKKMIEIRGNPEFRVSYQNVSKQERKLYDRFYSAKSAGTNPCRDFVF